MMDRLPGLHAIALVVRDPRGKTRRNERLPKLNFRPALISLLEEMQGHPRPRGRSMIGSTLLSANSLDSYRDSRAISPLAIHERLTGDWLIGIREHPARLFIRAATRACGQITPSSP